MNKKQAEEEAVRKAKDDKHAAGKNSGMSGRDLVRFTRPHNRRSVFDVLFSFSLRTTRSGSRTKRRTRRIGTLPNTERSRRKRLSPQRKSASELCSCREESNQKWASTMQTAARRSTKSRNHPRHCVQASACISIPCPLLHIHKCYSITHRH